MYPKSTLIRGCIVTPVAFVCLFSTVLLQMCPQIACRIGGKVTQAAFVCLFSTMCSQMCPQIACLMGCKITEVAFVCLFLLCVLMCCLKLPLLAVAQLHWLHLIDISPLSVSLCASCSRFCSISSKCQGLSSVNDLLKLKKF